MPRGDSEETPQLVGLTSLWDTIGSLACLQKLGPAMVSAELRWSTKYPVWLSITKALAFRWACDRLEDPLALPPQAMYFAQQKKGEARRARAIEARAKAEVSIED